MAQEGLSRSLPLHTPPNGQRASKKWQGGAVFAPAIAAQDGRTREGKQVRAWGRWAARRAEAAGLDRGFYEVEIKLGEHDLALALDAIRRAKKQSWGDRLRLQYEQAIWRFERRKIALKLDDGAKPYLFGSFEG